MTGAGEVDISPNPGRRITGNVDRNSYPQQIGQRQLLVSTIFTLLFVAAWQIG